MPIHRFEAVMALWVVGTLAATASAQPVGTFRWQQQPYCNVFTLSVVQVAGVYQLDGTDDQCGALTRASVSGLAFPNPNGTIGMGLAVVTAPGGQPVHVDATITLATVGGTWRDSSGGSGPFVFTPGAAVAGSPRPVPIPSFPAGLTVGGGTVANVAAPVAAGDATNKAYVDGLVAVARAALLNAKVWSAWVNSNGTKLGTGRFTSSQSGPGSYAVTFDLTGLGVPASTLFPPAAVTPVSCAGGSAQISSGLVQSQGAILTNVSYFIAIVNAAGTATNCPFMVLMHAGDVNAPGSPVSPLDGKATDPSCSTVGDVTTCVFGRPG